MPLTLSQRNTLIWTAVAALLLWSLWALGPVLTPFAAAAVLAYVLEPGVRWLAARRVPRVVAVLAVMLVAFVAIIAVALILLPIIQFEITQVRMRFPSLVAAIGERLLPWINQTFGVELALDPAAFREWVGSHLAASGDDLVAMLLAYAQSGWTAATQVIGLVFLVPVIAFFMLLDWRRLVERLRELVPPRWRAGSFDLLGEVDTLLGQYLRGQLLVMISLAAYYSIGLLIAGFHLWMPIGVLTGLLVFIPYLGFGLGLVFALVSGMLQFGPLHGLVAVGIVYGIGQFVESFVLTPRLVGERIGLHPIAVLLALLAFGALFGFVGVLIALPLSAVIAVGLRRLRQAWLASDFYRQP